MNLTQPWLLLLGAAGIAAITIVAALGRRRATKRTFTAVFLLPRGGAGRLHTALPWLDVALIALALALMTFSLAGPAVGQTQPVAAGLVVDSAALTSSTTNGVREVAAAAAATLGPSQRWGFFTTSGDAIAYGRGPAELSSLATTYRMRGGLLDSSSGGIQLAAARMAAHTGGTPVLVVVGAADTFADLGAPGQLAAAPEGDGVNVIRLGLGQPALPVITNSVTGPTLVPTGAAITLRVDLENTTPIPTSCEVRLESGGAVVARATVRLAARATGVQEIKVTPPATGVYEYEIVVAPDAFAAQRIPRQVVALPARNALIVASSATANPLYVDRALKACPLVDEVTIVEPEVLDVGRLRQSLTGSSILVMDGVAASLFPDALSREVKTWVEQGGVLVFAYGSPVALDWRQNILGQILPSFTGTKDGGLIKAEVTNDPLVAGLGLESSPLAIYRWLTVDAPKDTVLVSVGGVPMLTKSKVGSGSVLCWATTMATSGNNWPLHPSFPIFWSNLVAYSIGGIAAISQSAPAALPPRASSPRTVAGVTYVDYQPGKPVAIPPAALVPLQASSRNNADWHPAALAGALLALAALAARGIRRRRQDT